MDYEEVLVLNRESRNDPELRKRVSESLTKERELAAEALAHIEKAQALIREAQRLPFNSLEGRFIDNAAREVFGSKRSLENLADSTVDLTPDSTYVGNAAAHVGAKVERRPL